MSSDFSKDDILELERRRLIDQVTASVEDTLRKRYTWLAIIISFLLGSGVFAAFTALTNNAQKKLTEVETHLERAKTLLQDVENLSNSVTEKFKELNKQLSGSVAGKLTQGERLQELGEQLKEVDSKINSLKEIINPLLEKQGITNVDLPSVETKLSGTLARINLSKYIVYLHYARQEDKVPMDNLSNFLKDKGYVVPGIEKVKIEQRDIRYFHEDEKTVAEQLQRNVYEFIQSAPTRKDISLELKDLSLSYLNVQKGQLELWIYF